MNFLQLKITFLLIRAPPGHEARREAGGRDGGRKGERERRGRAQPQKVRLSVCDGFR